MNLLITGASGFLGRQITPILEKFYRVQTLGISEKNDIVVDLRNRIPVLGEKYDVVVHAAGKAHILGSSRKDLFEVNLEGTINLCRALEQTFLPQSFIFISSVSVYGLDRGQMVTEESPLNGNSYYALSKIQAEQYLTKWCAVNNIKLSIIRPALIAGPNPPGNLGAMINGIKSGKYLSIGAGSARKSILMAEDIGFLIPKLQDIGGIYNVCDNNHPSFAQLESLIATQLGKRKPYSIPFIIAKFLGLVGDVVGEKFPLNTVRLQKITEDLTFSSYKAQKELNWSPTDVLENFKIY